MYAAAGGASIASRRKKEKQLNNRRAAVEAHHHGGLLLVPPRSLASRPNNKFVRPHLLPPPSSAQLPPSSSYHQHAHQHRQYPRDHLHSRPRRRNGETTKTTTTTTTTATATTTTTTTTDPARRRQANKWHLKLPPVSPVLRFPISPPPLSLESLGSTNASNFPFPPPTILATDQQQPTLQPPPQSPLTLPLPLTLSLPLPQCGGQGPGRAAWLGCNNRPSPLPLSPVTLHSHGDGTKRFDKSRQREAYCRWKQKNKIRDASYFYESSGEYDEEDVRRDQEEGDSRGVYRPRGGEVSAAVNTVLYAGLGTTALGLVISFVGTGEKGFLSPELKLVGPSLLCAGLLCCLFRVLLCLCLCRCVECQEGSAKREKAKESQGTGSLPTASLLPLTQQHHQQRSTPHTTSPTTPSAPPSVPPLAPVSAPPSISPSISPSVPPSSSSSSSAIKGNELLLSPAQLPE